MAREILATSLTLREILPRGTSHADLDRRSAVDCDIVVAQPTVSGRHCRLTQTVDGFLLEDLGSSNGTYVDGARIISPTEVSEKSVVTLGAAVPMPWPQLTAKSAARFVLIGRDADNDVILDDPRVSGRHARLVRTDSQTLIEDLSSSNGTFVNSPDRKATKAIALVETDVVYFGSRAVPASLLLTATPNAQ